MNRLSKGHFQNPHQPRHQGYELETELAVSPGRVVAVVGESGVGKSVFVRDWIDVSRGGSKKASRSCVAYVPQDPQLFEECTIRRNIVLLSQGAAVVDVLANALEPVRGVLRKHLRYSPQVLSGGQRRLLGLACAGASRGQTVVLDETLVSLDPRTLDAALEAVRGLAEGGRAVVVVTHDARVMGAADEIYEVRLTDGARRISRRAEEPKDRRGSRSIGTRALCCEGEAAEHASRSSRWRFLGINLLGALAALAAVMGLLMMPRLVGTAEAVPFLPDIGDIGSAVVGNAGALLREGWYTMRTAAAALGIAVTLSGLFGLLVHVLGAWKRVGVMATWIALQGIPVVVFAPLMQLVCDVDDRWVMVLVTACFIAVFPLGVMVGRVVVATPEDVFRGTAARGRMERFKVALLWNKGSVARAVVACSPLAAIGVVVAEYVVGDRGMGHLMWTALTGGQEVAVRYTYALACSGIATAVFISTTLIAVAFQPRDVALD